MKIIFMIACILIAFPCLLSKQIRLPTIQKSTLVIRKDTPTGTFLTTINKDGDIFSSSTVELRGNPNTRGHGILVTSATPSERSTITTTRVTGRGEGVSISSFGSSLTSISLPSNSSSLSNDTLPTQPERTEISLPINADLNGNISERKLADGAIGDVTFALSDFNENSIASTLPELIAIPITMTWKILPIETKNFYVSNTGVVYAINTNDNILYYYDELKNKFLKVQSLENTNMPLSSAVVSVDNTPYVIDNLGNTYYLKNNHWNQLPGCATMIALGRNGSIYKLGCYKEEGGYEVYMLQCIQGNTLVYNFPHLLNESVSCDWFSLNGKGIKIAVLDNGLPLIIDANEHVHYFTGNKWNSFLGIEGKDAAVSNSGLLMFIDIENKLYAINYSKHPMEVHILGNAKKVSIGPFSIPVILGTDNVLYIANSLVLD